VPASERPFADGADSEVSACWSTADAWQPRPSSGPALRPPVARLNGESVATFRPIRAAATRAACGVLVSSHASFAHADESMHSGPMRTFGAIDSVECTVTNVRAKPVEDVRILIRSINWVAVVSGVTCTDLAQWSECRASFPTSGAAVVVRPMCSVEATGRRDELRGKFQRWSPTGQSDEIAIGLDWRRAIRAGELAPRTRSPSVPGAHARVRPIAAFAAPGTRRDVRARPSRKARA